MIRIGLADDEDLVRDGIAALLSHQQGMIVVTTVSSVFTKRSNSPVPVRSTCCCSTWTLVIAEV